MIKNYFKIAWRNIIRNRVYSFINIAGLAMGLAAAMLIMLYAKDEVSYDRFHRHKSISSRDPSVFQLHQHDTPLPHK